MGNNLRNNFVSYVGIRNDLEDSKMQCKLGPRKKTALEIAGGVVAAVGIAALAIPGIGEGVEVGVGLAENAIALEIADLGGLAVEAEVGEVAVEAAGSEGMAVEEGARVFEYPTPKEFIQGEEGEPAGGEPGAGPEGEDQRPFTHMGVLVAWRSSHEVAAAGIPVWELKKLANPILDTIITSYIGQVENRLQGKGFSTGKATSEIYKSKQQTLSLLLTAVATTIQKQASTVVVKSYSKNVVSGAGGNSTKIYHVSNFKTEQTQKVEFKLTVKAYPTNVQSMKFKASGQRFKEMTSVNKKYFLTMQSDGNLVLYKKGSDGNKNENLWHTGTFGNTGAGAVMQGDGNLVVYSSTGKPLFSSGTDGNHGAYLALQDDGKVVIVSAEGSLIWSHGGTQ